MGRGKPLTKTAFDGCNLRTMKNVSHLHLENNTINPEITGVYYTIFKGSSGDSIICKITPSSQMFKSVDGPNGPFTPNEILLFPEIFNTYFKAWYYSVDSINWEPVVSGEHGLEVGTFNEKENTRFRKGMEKGHFELAGSTIVLLFEPGQVQMRQELQEALSSSEEIRVLQGQWIATAEEDVPLGRKTAVT